MAFEGKGLGDPYSGTSAMLLRAKVSEQPAPLMATAPWGQEKAGFEFSIFSGHAGFFFFFWRGGGETQKSRFTLCTIPYCLGSQWIREEQVARRPSHPTSPRPSNVDICSFMDCLGIQFNSEFHNMKVNPWCFTITLYLECSFSSFFYFFFLQCWRSKRALKQGTEVSR